MGGAEVTLRGHSWVRWVENEACVEGGSVEGAWLARGVEKVNVPSLPFLCYLRSPLLRPRWSALRLLREQIPMVSDACGAAA